MSLAKYLIRNGNVVLSEKKYNCGTLEDPDIVSERVWAVIEGAPGRTKEVHANVVIYSRLEDSGNVFEPKELCRTSSFRDYDSLDLFLDNALD